MKRIILLLGLLGVIGSSAQDKAPTDGRITVMGFSKGRETVVQVGSSTATTIRFPKEIGTVIGYGLTQGGEEIAMLAKSKVALFHYQQMGKLLVVRNIKSGNPCSVTVSMDDGLYLLRLVPSDTPNIAVTLAPAESLKPMARHVTSDEVLAKRTKYSAAQLIGILNQARQRKALESTMPGLYASVKERNNLKLSSDFGGVSSTVEEIQRFPDKDATVLLGVVANQLPYAIQYDPQGVLVRVGDRDYPAQLVDGSGWLLAGGKAALHVVMQGNADGGKDHVSIENDFRLILPHWEKWEQQKEQSAKSQPKGGSK